MAKSELNWVEIDPSTLNANQQEAYKAYKEAYRVMKECRQQFEGHMQDGVAMGKRIVCGYNFGKLSIALTDDERKPTKAKGAGSLADFLANANASGHRC